MQLLPRSTSSRSFGANPTVQSTPRDTAAQHHLPRTLLSVRFPKPAAAALGRNFSVATGRFQESEFHWPLFGGEFEERTVASRPTADVADDGKRTVRNVGVKAAPQPSALNVLLCITVNAY